LVPYCHERLARNTDLAAERTVERDDQHDDERQRGCHRRRYHQVHLEALHAEQVCVTDGDGTTEENDPPHHLRNLSLCRQQPRPACTEEFVQRLHQLLLYDTLSCRRRPVTGDQDIELAENVPTFLKGVAIDAARLLGWPFVINNGLDVVL